MRLANATPERLREVTALNLDALETILRWNAEHDIRVFRISSNTIPFGSHPANNVRWWEEFAPRLAELGALMDGMSISTHPGQYTVLGSGRPEVVEASLAELEYQALLLRSFGLDAAHKMVIHLSGTPERFLAAVERLSSDAQARLVVENDERWSLEDVLALGLTTVFDVFHHRLRPSFPELDVRATTLLAGETSDDPSGGALLDAGSGQASGGALGDARSRGVRRIRAFGRRPRHRLRARGERQGALGDARAEAAQLKRSRTVPGRPRLPARSTATTATRCGPRSCGRVTLVCDVVASGLPSIVTR